MTDLRPLLLFRQECSLMQTDNLSSKYTKLNNYSCFSSIYSSVAAQVELDFNSVERVLEYLDVEQEAPAIIEKSRPPAYWPSNSGGLEVENLTVRYAPHLPLALRGISFSVRPSEKIGVVGRTGSGNGDVTSCNRY